MQTLPISKKNRKSVIPQGLLSLNRSAFFVIISTMKRISERKNSTDSSLDLVPIKVQLFNSSASDLRGFLKTLD